MTTTTSKTAAKDYITMAIINGDSVALKAELNNLKGEYAAKYLLELLSDNEGNGLNADEVLEMLNRFDSKPAHETCSCGYALGHPGLCQARF